MHFEELCLNVIMSDVPLVIGAIVYVYDIISVVFVSKICAGEWL